MNRNHKKPLAKRLQQAVRELAGADRPVQSAAQFGRLYEEKHVLVFRHIYGLCGGPTALAEDLTAETFMRAWQARTSFTGDRDAAVGWLLRIARNLVIDYHRRGIEQRTVLFTDDLEYVAPTERPEEALILAEQHAVLLTLLQELPVLKREMIVLRYLLGWRVVEIAGYLEMPENTVTVTIQRTLQHMRYRWPMITTAKEEEHVEV
jgi:RNA polymerase sigma-70 factor (ECF subfamily)